MLLKQSEPSPVAPSETPVVDAAPMIETPVEAAPAEVVEEEKSPSPQEDPKFAAKFAALSRREQSLRQKEQSFKEQETKWKAFESEQKLLEENPLEYLAKKGLTFDKLTQLALNDGKKPAEMRVQELEDRLEREKKEREENEKSLAQKQYDERRQNFVGEISEFIDTNKDAYELISVADEPAELIYNVIEQQYRRTQRVLPIKDAVEMVEKHLEKELEEKYLSKNKVKSKFAPKVEAQVAPGAAPVAPATKAQTLTNSQASAVATPHTNKIMSVEESKREASKLLKWT